MSAAGFRLAAAMSIALGLITAAVVWDDQPWSWVLVIASLPWVDPWADAAEPGDGPAVVAAERSPGSGAVVGTGGAAGAAEGAQG